MAKREAGARAKRPLLLLLTLGALLFALSAAPTAGQAGDDEGDSVQVSLPQRSRLRKSSLPQRSSRLRRSRSGDADVDVTGAGGSTKRRYRRSKGEALRASGRQRRRAEDEDDAMNDLLDLEKSLEKANADSDRRTSSLVQSRKQLIKTRKRQSSTTIRSDEVEEGEDAGSEATLDSNGEADAGFESSTSSVSRSSNTAASRRQDEDDQETSSSTSAGTAGAGESVDPERADAAQALTSLKEEFVQNQGSVLRSPSRSSAEETTPQSPPIPDTSTETSEESVEREADAKKSLASDVGDSADVATSDMQLHFENPAQSKYAYVSILYCGTPRDYEYFVGLRVTMQTLKQTETNADLVVIAGPKTPARWLKTLADDGIRIVSAENVENLYFNMESYKPRFRFVLNKLLAWLLTDYKRVVLLDADNLVLQNMDELFLCGDFCAAFINPCIFHTGLMVLKPSKKVFRRMQRQLAVLPSFDGADQGFLNSFFPNLLKSPLFEPPPNASFPAALTEFKALRGHFRLPMGYQMDSMYYNLNFKWDVPCSPNKVITFPGISALKPWYWWTWPLLPLSLQWHMWRLSTIGASYEVAVALLLGIFWLSLLVGDKLWGFFEMLLCKRKAAPGSPRSPSSKGKATGGMSAWGVRFGLHRSLAAGKGILRGLLGAVSLPASAVAAYMTVPSTAHPFLGWPLFLVAMLGSLRLLRVVLGASRAPYWMPSFIGSSVVVLALPIYSAVAFKVVTMHLLAFCGGLVTLLVYQSIYAPRFDKVDLDHSRAD